MTIENRLSALLSDAPPESPASAETAEGQIKQNESEAETPQGDTEAKNNRRRKMKLGEHEIEIDILTDDPDLIDLVPKGLQMEADYTRKTMKLAEERKAVEQETQKYRDKVKDLEVSLELDIEDLESAEMKELKEYAPDEYLAKFEKAQKKAERLKKAKDELSKKDLEARQKLAQNEVSKWTDAVPDWLDEDVKIKEIQMISKSLKDVGFDDHELEDMFDHRLIKQLRKAALYDQIKSQKIEPKAKESKPPRAVNSKGSDESENVLSEYKKTRERLKASGKVDDAAAAIKKLLSGG